MVKYSIEWNDDGWQYNGGKEFNESYFHIWQALIWMHEGT